jgi:hypothetical protein
VCGQVLPAIQRSKNRAYCIPRKMFKKFLRADYFYGKAMPLAEVLALSLQGSPSRAL